MASSSSSEERRGRHADLQPVDRWRVILERVAADQTIQVTELARQLVVSDMTIRRDLRRLERDGYLRRTYGGATAHITRSFDASFNARALEHAREKRLIGMRAAELVGAATTVFLGIGSTTEQFARYLPAREGLTVVTASLPIASLLGTRPVRVVAIGGSVLRDELSCHGPAALRTLATYHFDLAVIGAAGLSVRWGITELDDDEAEVQRTAVDRSSRVMVLADGSKLGRTTPHVIGPATLVSTLVTDSTARGPELDAWRDQRIEVVIAEPRQRPRDAASTTDTGAASRAMSRRVS
ncbi:MAG TPA: DeoR/GlpR family DNA-binding transcription regulator [Candidatus Limnocylindrales bacterium]|jgi:DeoR/GlpR family transcriptional regulator of sugar metabolism